MRSAVRSPRVARTERTRTAAGSGSPPSRASRRSRSTPSPVSTSTGRGAVHPDHPAGHRPAASGAGSASTTTVEAEPVSRTAARVPGPAGRSVPYWHHAHPQRGVLRDVRPAPSRNSRSYLLRISGIAIPYSRASRSRGTSRAIPATEAFGNFAHPHARVVSSARGRATSSCCSVHDRAGHRGSAHRQVRLRQTGRTGRPKHGTSTSTTSRRPWLATITPQLRQLVTAATDSTTTRSRSSYRSTPMTWKPSSPTNRSHRSQ